MLDDCSFYRTMLAGDCAFCLIIIVSIYFSFYLRSSIKFVEPEGCDHHTSRVMRKPAFCMSEKQKRRSAAPLAPLISLHI